MSDNFLNKLEELLSPKKIAAYKIKFADNWFEAYKSKLALAKEVFTYLHFLEIFLRNKIAAEFSADFGDWLLDARCSLNLNFKEQEKVGKVLAELSKMDKTLDSNNIISSLNFGFWTNLFHKSYHVPV
jgi:hypothetical protein